jgi:uncharacterized protein (TIGR02147 family)
MNSIFTYDDYRQYLRDFYQERKGQSHSYSFRYFAKKAGLNSPNYFKLVMDGERSLTHRNIHKFAIGLGLGEKERIYFENLVYFNQASDATEKDVYAKNLESLRKHDDRTLLTPDQYEIYSNWYPLAIRELLLFDNFDTSPKRVAARFDHRFTPQQAKEALALLTRLRFIEADPKTGKLRVTRQSMQTPDLTKSDAILKFHKTMIQMTAGAVESQTSKERCLSSLTVSVNKKDLPEAFRRVSEFCREMDALFGKSKNYDSVYQMNVQLFRLDCDVD